MTRRREPPKHRQGERGAAVLLAAVLGFLAMAIWAVTYRATFDTIRSERFLATRADLHATTARALAYATSLLRTGIPPTDPYSCIVGVGAPGEATACTATYASAGSPDTWSLEVGLSTSREQDDLPRAPTSFSD